MSVSGLAVPCLPGPCGISGLGDHLAETATSTATTAMLGALVSWVVAGASWFVQHAIALIEPETTVNLDAKWFMGREWAMLEIAALLIAPLLGAATIGAVVRQDGRRLVRVYGVGLPVGVLGATAAVALTQLALELVNALCRLIAPAGTYTPFLRLGAVIGQQEVPIFVRLVVASIVVLAAVILWMEMVLRAAVLYIVVFFLPFGLAAFVWPATAHITKRFVELVVAIIGSKFVIVATLTLGGAVIGQGHLTVDAGVTGTAILLLAAFAPFSVLRIVPLVEATATSHLEGMSRRPARAVTAAGTAAISSGGRMAGLLGQLGAGPEAATVLGGVTAMDIGEQIGEWSIPSDGHESSAPKGEARPGSSAEGPSGPGGWVGTGGPRSGGDDRPDSSGRGDPSSAAGWGASSSRGDSGVGSRTGSGPSRSAAGAAFGSGPGSGAPDSAASSLPAEPWGSSPVPRPPRPVPPGISSPDPDGWSDDA